FANANQIFGTGNATAVQIENTSNGLLNFSGNANVIGVGNCSLRGGCGPTGDSQAVIIENTAFGNLNGSRNANSVGTGGANLKMINNTFLGNLKAAGNGNGGANGANTTAASAEIDSNFMQGNLNGSGNGNGAVQFSAGCTDNNPGTP